jgi:hypothetical protein
MGVAVKGWGVLSKGFKPVEDGGDEDKVQENKGDFFMLHGDTLKDCFYSPGIAHIKVMGNNRQTCP